MWPTGPQTTQPIQPAQPTPPIQPAQGTPPAQSTQSPQPTRPISDGEIKHLEFIQAVVARLGNGSFLIKGWTMTVAGAFFGVLASGGDWRIACAGMVPILGFWMLDSYFLRQERLFRKLYDDVRSPTASIAPFSMNVRPYLAVVPFAAVVRSGTLATFYGTLALVDLGFVVSGIVRAVRG